MAAPAACFAGGTECDVQPLVDLDVFHTKDAEQFASTIAQVAPAPSGGLDVFVSLQPSATNNVPSGRAAHPGHLWLWLDYRTNCWQTDHVEPLPAKYRGATSRIRRTRSDCRRVAVFWNRILM